MRREAALERKIRDFCQTNGGLCIKQDASIYKGIPDRLIIHSNGKMFFTEFKDEKGVVSEIQKHWINKLRDLGVDTYIINNFDKFKEVWEYHG